MASLYDLFVRIQGDNSSYKRATREASQDTAQLSAGFDGLTKKADVLGSRMTKVGATMSAAITLPLAAAGTAIIKAAATMESLRMGLDSITKSGAETDKQLVRLKEVAKLPGLGFQEAVRGSINLQAAGFSANMAERSLKAFGNALATVGRGKDELDGVFRALTQIAAKGKVSAEEINQLQERLPQIRKAMKDAFGTADTEVLAKMGVSSEQFIAKIIAEFEKLPPVTSGLNNQFENLKDAMFIASVTAGQSLMPIATKVVEWAAATLVKVGDLASAFNKLPEPIKNTTIALTALLALTPLLTGAGGLLLSAISQVGRLIALLNGAAGVTAAVTAVSNSTALMGLSFTRVGGTIAAAGATAKAGWMWLIGPAGILAAGVGGWFAGDALQKRFGQATGVNTGGLDAINERYYGPRTPTATPKIGASILDYVSDKPVPKPDPNGGEVPAMLRATSIAQLVGAEETERRASAFKKLIDYIADMDAGLRKVDPVASAISKTLDVVANTNLPTVAQGVDVVSKTFEQALSPAIRESEALMHGLGLTSTRELRAQYDAARRSTEALIMMGASQTDITASAEVMSQKYKELSERLGNWDNQTKSATKTASVWGRQVSTILTDLSRQLADVVMGEKKIADAAKDIGKAFVRMILEDFIGKGISAATKALSGLLAHLGSVGKAIGGLLGGGASAAGSAAGAATSGAGVAGSSAGSIGSSVGGIAGAVNMASGIVSAVSGVIGNFQFAGMNKSLDLVVKHTLQVANDMFNLRRDLWDQHNGMRAIQNMIYGRMGEMQKSLGGGSGGGKYGLTFNNCNFTGSPDAIANAIFEKAALAGA
jgi:tape measure domain-containing protein